MSQEVVIKGGPNNTSALVTGQQELLVKVNSPIPLEVDINEANDSILVYGFDGTVNRKIKTDANGELQVDVLTMPATFAEDTAHVSGNTGAFVMGVRNDSNTAMTSANGDYSPIAVNNNGAVAIQDGGNSITVDGGVGIARTTGLLRPTGAGNVNTVAATFFSVSVANVGAADGDILGGTNNIKPGEVLNFSADAINNYFTTFAYDATGTEFIIIFVY